MQSTVKIAVYTVIVGPYDGLLPQPPAKNIDYLCFTDQKFKSKTWKIIPIEVENNDPVRTARKHKILAHTILDEYQYSVFVDGNYLIKKDLSPLVEDVFSNAPMGIFDHNQCSDARNCVYEEHQAIVRLHSLRMKFKDDPTDMQRQMDAYRGEGYPKQNGLIFSAALIRQHHHPDVIKTMEIWYEQILKYSKRDQLSFNYAAWKADFHPYYINGDLRNNEFFFLLSKHRKSYKWKYFKYRTKKLVGLI